MLNEKYKWLHKLYTFKPKPKYKYLNDNTKIIHNTKDNNSDLYQNLNTHMLLLDRSYKILIISVFIITILIILK